MIVLKSRDEIEKLRAANRIVVEVMARLAEHVVPGVTTLDLDQMAEEEIRRRGGVPSFIGYHGYRHTLCTSVDQVVVHGIPNATPLREGQLVSIDCGVYREGFHGDHAQTLVVGGEPSAAVRALIQCAEESLALGIEQMQPNALLFDISAAIQHHVESHGYSIVRDYVGHGVGRELHEEPQVPNFGMAGTGMKMLPGLVLALEPMINQGGPAVRLLEDGWTVVTADGSLSVHVEHSVALTEQGPDILSRA